MPGFELVSPCPFPTTITITPRAPTTRCYRWIDIKTIDIIIKFELSFPMTKTKNYNTTIISRQKYSIKIIWHEDICVTCVNSNISKFSHLCWKRNKTEVKNFGSMCKVVKLIQSKALTIKNHWNCVHFPNQFPIHFVSYFQDSQWLS